MSKANMAAPEVCVIGQFGPGATSNSNFCRPPFPDLAQEQPVAQPKPFKNLEKTLQRAGGTLKDVVWMTVAVSYGRFSQRFTDIRKEIYGTEFPASTLLTAASFAIPEIMVEITPIAVVAA